MVLAVGLAAATACYEPALRDCVVSCAAADECAADQQCAGGWCASPGTVCTGGGDDEDAGNGGGGDARVIDAPPSATLRIEVKEHGRVDTDQSGVDCSGPNGNCMFSIMDGTEVTLTAVENHPNYRFEKWTDDCDGEQSLSCTVTVDAPMTRVGAEFKRDDDDD